MRRWKVRPSDESLASKLAAATGLRPLTARVLVTRGLGEESLVSRFLTPRLANMRPPEGIADLEVAITRLLTAICEGERVGVFGDYDVDGVTTAAVLTLSLRAMGADVVSRVASRSSGYGLGTAHVGHFVEQGCRVIVTGDCGTSDHDALALCRERGIDAIVIDHHQVPERGTQAHALINPHRPDDHFPFKGLASCGVAFYLGATLRSRLRALGRAPAERFDPRTLLDLVALGTIGDLVPLVDENRILVSAGLRELAVFRRPGLRALARLAALQPGALTTTDVAFRLIPRLNAAGRLGEAQLALDLLLAVDESEAERHAAALDQINRERQRIQEEVLGEALAQAEQQVLMAALVVGAEGWHQGVVGIIAAKLVDRYRRPAIVVGFREGQGRGSARTTGGFDLYQALVACREHLSAYGGHAAAAGLSVAWDSLPAFRQAFVLEAHRHFGGTPEEPPLEVDAVAELAELDLSGIEELERLAPFGAANAEPLVAVPGVVTRASRIVGTNHLQLTLSRGPAVADAIGFGLGESDPGEGAALDVIGTPEVDSFRGLRRTRLRLKHLLRAPS